MTYVHVKNLEKYQPGYTDRKHIWAKIYFDTFLDPEVQQLNEIDRYRFWSLIVLEVYLEGKPLALTDQNLKLMGWEAKKRHISLTLQMLHTLVEVRNNEPESSVPQIRVEKSRVDKNKYMSIFDEAQKIYLGTKRGLEVEFENFVWRSKHPKAGMPPFNFIEVLPRLKPAIESQIANRKQKKAVGEFVPPWKNFKTWINNHCWEEETPVGEADKKPAVPLQTATCIIDHKPYSDFKLNGQGKPIYLCLDCIRALGGKDWGTMSKPEIERAVEEGKRRPPPVKKDSELETQDKKQVAVAKIAGLGDKMKG